MKKAIVHQYLLTFKMLYNRVNGLRWTQTTQKRSRYNVLEIQSHKCGVMSAVIDTMCQGHVRVHART
jgi:hypothetical protein